ncbi:MAG: alpha-galactosidase [Verrucomicrobia bacterium]|nr:alpha-galactosidase [Verrucomicrobiota bacterium]
MKHTILLLPLIVVVFGSAFTTYAGQSPAAWSTAQEMATAEKWVKRNLSARAEPPPFSFVYGGKSSADLLGKWKVKRETRKLDKLRTGHTITYNDTETGLSVRLEAVTYSDFPTVEWTLYFKNTGNVNTPILENIKALDIQLERGSKGEFVLHHQPGSQMIASEYQPLETRLGPGTEKQFIAEGGRPSSAYLPYFNIEWQGAGVIVVIGWPGQWSAKFTRTGNSTLRVSGGQDLTHFTLYPGEELRAPLIALQFWKGDWIHSQNVWRRWMITHNLPRPGGELPPPLSTPCSSHQYWEMQGATEENQKMFIDRYIENGLKPDYWWMDAGWYVNVGHWANTGTWEVDTNRFPHGLRAISDHAHSRGVKTLAWFEPERVSGGTWLAQNHPEWILGGTNGGLLNLGNLEARRWVIEHFDKLLVGQGLDLYRQDFNMDPTPSWRANDAADRKGVTEIQHVVGYLAFWDELRRRHPDMIIDSCAQGGRRNDLETLRRAVPFIRSDYLFEPVGQQCHMYGISLWMPYNGTGVRSAAGQETERYIFRSSMAIHLTPCWDLRREGDPVAFKLAITPPRNIDLVRRLVSQWRQVAPDYYGDYYPLTSYSLSNDVWMAWQFDRPEAGKGMVQVFRRAENGDSENIFKLRGLDSKTHYLVRNLDEASAQVMTGYELSKKGLAVRISRQPGSALITYNKSNHK